jgi:hypothetical protein
MKKIPHTRETNIMCNTLMAQPTVTDKNLQSLEPTNPRIITDFKQLFGLDHQTVDWSTLRTVLSKHPRAVLFPDTYCCDRTYRFEEPDTIDSSTNLWPELLVTLIDNNEIDLLAKLKPSVSLFRNRGTGICCWSLVLEALLKNNNETLFREWYDAMLLDQYHGCCTNRCVEYYVGHYASEKLFDDVLDGMLKGCTVYQYNQYPLSSRKKPIGLALAGFVRGIVYGDPDQMIRRLECLIARVKEKITGDDFDSNVLKGNLLQVIWETGRNENIDQINDTNAYHERTEQLCELLRNHWYAQSPFLEYYNAPSDFAHCCQIYHKETIYSK